ncbi:hypothetical protein OF83DRAFT_1088484 [Amylostereum chailletii]|nr:hypothetical protein OF83DRAFT_1088484 [Amylostereum chailletii]
MDSQSSFGPQRLQYQLKDLQRERDVLQKNVTRLEQDLIDALQREKWKDCTESWRGSEGSMRDLRSREGEGSNEKFTTTREVEIIEISDDEDEKAPSEKYPPLCVHMNNTTSTEVSRPTTTVEGTDSKALGTFSSTAGGHARLIEDENSRTESNKRRWLQIVDGKTSITRAPHNTKHPKIEGKSIKLETDAFDVEKSDLSDLSDLSNLTSSSDDDNDSNYEDEDEDETQSNAQGVALSRRAIHGAGHAHNPGMDWGSYTGPSVPIRSNLSPPRTSGPFPSPLSTRVAAIPSFIIPTLTPPPTPVSRPFLTETYSCAARQLLGQITASKNVPSGEIRHMIWPEMAPNPGLPRARGQPGTVVSMREDMDDLARRGVNMTLWVKVEGDGKPRWLYFGEYMMKRCKEDLRKEEFCAFSKLSQRKWAHILVTSMRECFAVLAARVWFHKYAGLGSPPRDNAIRTKTEEIVRAHK